jgi:aspartate carbamoyltransferase catalytic subunit
MSPANKTRKNELAERFSGRDVISMRDFSRDDVVALLDACDKFEDESGALLHGKILANLFFEPSTRTRLSFHAAMARLGGTTIGFADASISSVAKGESLTDTIRVVENYCDVIVIRHKFEGAARVAAHATSLPVINGGDGSNQHPTQTLLDLFTIRKLHGRISGLRVAFLGDLRYSRTVHSLIETLARFECDLVLVSPPELRLPSDLLDDLVRYGVRCREEIDPNVLPADVDILYTTRIQKERFPDALEYEKVKNAYTLDRKALSVYGRTVTVMHPLPRVNEISPDLDEYEGAAYFKQAMNGVTVRKALLSLVFGKIPG